MLLVIDLPWRLRHRVSMNVVEHRASLDTETSLSLNSLGRIITRHVYEGKGQVSLHARVLISLAVKATLCDLCEPVAISL